MTVISMAWKITRDDISAVCLEWMQIGAVESMLFLIKYLSAIAYKTFLIYRQHGTLLHVRESSIVFFLFAISTLRTSA
jgi:hypothetical protein